MNPLDALLADLAETLGNALLNLDADAKERLAGLEGRCIRIECAQPSKSATLEVRRSRIAVSAQAIGEADAVVQGSVAELVAWVASGASAESAAVRIEGDPGVLAEVMAAVRPSLFNPLSSTLSSSPGEDVIGALELAAAGLRSAAEGAAHALEQGLAPAADGSSPLAQLAPRFEPLRDGVLKLARRARELAKPTRSDPS